MSNQVMKPTSIERVEFIGAMTELINSSNLPPYVIEPILKDMVAQVSNLSYKQYQEDLVRYQQQLKATQEASKN